MNHVHKFTKDEENQLLLLLFSFLHIFSLGGNCDRILSLVKHNCCRMRILNKENQWFKEYVLEYRNKKAINIAYVETDII